MSVNRVPMRSDWGPTKTRCANKQRLQMTRVEGEKHVMSVREKSSDSSWSIRIIFIGRLKNPPVLYLCILSTVSCIGIFV